MNAETSITADCELESPHEIDFAEVMVALSSIDHNLSIYLKSFVEREGGEFAPFYLNIVNEQLANVAQIRAEMQRAMEAA